MEWECLLHNFPNVTNAIAILSNQLVEILVLKHWKLAQDMSKRRVRIGFESTNFPSIKLHLISLIKAERTSWPMRYAHWLEVLILG